MSIQQAKADLAQARLEAEKFAARAKEALERVQKLENFLEMARQYEIIEDVASTKGADRNNVLKPRRSGLTTLHVAVEVLREAQGRLTTRQLLDRIEGQGHTVGGANKAANLASILSKSTVVNTNKTEGWGLSSWDAKPPQIPVEDPIEDFPF